MYKVMKLQFVRVQIPKTLKILQFHIHESFDSSALARARQIQEEHAEIEIFDAKSSLFTLTLDIDKRHYTGY
ncbi:hypothetical protein DCAR_0935426 [Daucus carota subsp. sativus]|uniref:Uncharacterized protein n=1 Tax=Daucus carota subsp. sativus TaxID=79200 RepID=A0A175YIA2_DAUCS|nr:hypothetical protein DCAR_0935426 [Daucus carota subsp. sativus]